MARQREFDRGAVLERAMHLFWTKGHDGTSVADLTGGMGLSRSSLYETFGGKDDLFAETVASYVDFVDRRRAHLLSRGTSARQALRDYFGRVIDFTMSDRLPGGCYFTNTATALETADARVREIIRRGDERQERDFIECLRRGEASGEIPAGKDVRALAHFLGGVVRGLTVLARMHKQRKVLEDVVAVGLTVLD